MRPFSVHHAHQNSFDLGEASRLLGAFGAWWISSGMLLLDAVVGGELLLLRVASRYSLSPPGVLLWALGKGLRIFCVWAVFGRLGGINAEDAVLGTTSA